MAHYYVSLLEFKIRPLLGEWETKPTLGLPSFLYDLPFQMQILCGSLVIHFLHNNRDMFDFP